MRPRGNPIRLTLIRLGQSGPNPLIISKGRIVTDFLSFKPFSVRVERQALGDRVARTVIHVAGELDVATSGLLAAAVARAMEAGNAGRADLVVDLAHVRFIDASGVNVLIRATSRARSAGGTLVLRSPSRTVRRILDVLRLREVLTVE